MSNFKFLLSDPQFVSFAEVAVAAEKTPEPRATFNAIKNLIIKSADIVQAYYDTISAETGFEIRNDGELMSLLTGMSRIKKAYDRIADALQDVEETGYGVVMPTPDQMQLAEPEIVRRGGRYGVVLKANAPAIHMIKTNIETEVSPALGGESASEEIMNFLLQGFSGDISKIWESNIFGKSLYDIAGDSLAAKINNMPEDVRGKLQNTLQRIVNEGSGGLICILL